MQALAFVIQYTVFNDSIYKYIIQMYMQNSAKVAIIYRTSFVFFSKFSGAKKRYGIGTNAV